MADQDLTTDADRLGRAVHLRRVELGLKRPELAKRAELSYPYVSEIENGLKTPSTKALRQLAAALDLSPAELIERADRLGDPAGMEASSVLAEHTPTERIGLGVPRPPESATGRAEAGAIRPMWSRQLESEQVDDRKTQILIAAVVRAELAAWARTELPILVRTALEQALSERGK